ncbi:MAG: serine/threonine-protein kinase [Myxococcales bacterium]|nr:serine/threonine protein kinase [Polyangiaceae bacterium]MDW8250570.1 serine/threonine-protein kinase [Myxococcales bacterium]
MSATGSSPYPQEGDIIDGKYVIRKILGEGGMGAVMAAYHKILRSDVALKFMSPDVMRVPGAVERFMNEGVAARGIQSDHVVRVDDVGVLPSGLPYIVMEMLHGCDLSELLEREAPQGLPVPRAIHFVLQILRGLHVAHSKGIIHRDLKPSNAFVIQREGEPDFIKLLDFGISKITQEPGKEAQQLTQTNTGLGTPLYMSPEQARNAREANAQSDLYSVAAILYELLTGRTPYQAESPNDLLFKLFTAEPDPILSVRPDLPPALAEVIHKGLSKDPAQRPSSALEFAEQLIPFADARSTEVIARIRAAVGGIPASVVLAGEGRGVSILPSLPTIESTQVKSGVPKEVSAKTLLSPSLPTQLRVGGDAPVSSGLGLSAKIALGVGLLAITAGSAVLLTRPASPSPPMVGLVSSIEPPVTVLPERSAAPSESPSLPQVVPVVSSAPVASSAPVVPSLPTTAKTAGPVKPPTGKKNPFGVGIVQ